MTPHLEEEDHYQVTTGSSTPWRPSQSLQGIMTLRRMRRANQGWNKPRLSFQSPSHLHLHICIFIFLSCNIFQVTLLWNYHGLLTWGITWVEFCLISEGESRRWRGEWRRGFSLFLAFSSPRSTWRSAWQGVAITIMDIFITINLLSIYLNLHN